MMEVRVWLTTVGRGRETRVSGGARVGTHRQRLWQGRSHRSICVYHSHRGGPPLGRSSSPRSLCKISSAKAKRYFT